ncbi:hypothetical protein V6N12_075971 [Hibiscus sabdariffa]|uniref:Uncharacterized protein n=1 Tax=Hibiscus sabdariffa TaxID=183260 RepID=A0ABR2AXW1_9ROSI
MELELVIPLRSCLPTIEGSEPEVPIKEKSPSYNSFAIRNRRLTNPRWTGKATGSMSHTPDLRSTGSPGKIHNGVNQARLSMLPDLSVDWECPIGRDINARPKRCSNHRYEMKCDKSILGLQADARAPLLLSDLKNCHSIPFDMGHENEIRLVPLPAAIAVVEKRRCSRNVLARIALIPLSIFADIDLSFSSTKSRSSDPEWILLRRIASVLQRPKTYLYWRFKRFDVIDVVVWRPTASDPAPDLTAGFSLLL